MTAFDQLYTSGLAAPIAAGLFSIWDRAGVPLGLIGGLALCEGEFERGVTLTLCIIGGLVGDLACFALGRSLSARDSSSSSSSSSSSTTQSINASKHAVEYSHSASLNANRARSGWHALAQRSAPFVEISPRLWTLFSRCFPAINQWVHVALGITQRPWGEVIILSAIGNIMWFYGFAHLFARVGDQLLRGDATLSLVMTVIGVILMFSSLMIVQRSMLKRQAEIDLGGDAP